MAVNHRSPLGSEQLFSPRTYWKKFLSPRVQVSVPGSAFGRTFSIFVQERIFVRDPLFSLSGQSYPCLTPWPQSTCRLARFLIGMGGRTNPATILGNVIHRISSLLVVCLPGSTKLFKSAKPDSKHVSTHILFGPPPPPPRFSGL